MTTARRTVAFAVLFAAGVLAGVWTLASPWVAGFATGAGGAWTDATRSTLWVAGLTIALSAAALLVLPAQALHAQLGRRRRG